MTEQEVSQILATMNPQNGPQQQQQNQMQAQFHGQFDFQVPSNSELPPPAAATAAATTGPNSSTSILPPLPPLPEPLPGSGRRTRQAKTAAAQAVSGQSGVSDIVVDDDAENSGDYEEDLDDFQAEDDIIYDFQPDMSFSNVGPDGQSLSGSMSPNGTANGKGGRGRKPKTVVAAGVPKDSPDYQRLRKENHKNVEKKRRETINDGIKRLSNLVPGADKNKSKIINQAAEYIAALKNNEASNLEKWTLDKLMTEKTIRELQGEADRLRDEVDRRDKQIAELNMRLNKR